MSDLLTWIRKNGLTQAEAAQRLGASQQTVSRWLKSPPADIAVRLGQVVLAQPSGPVPQEPLPLRWFYNARPPYGRIQPVAWTEDRCAVQQAKDRNEWRKAKGDLNRFDDLHAHDGQLCSEWPYAPEHLEAEDANYNWQMRRDAARQYAELQVAQAERQRRHNELVKTWTNLDGSVILPPNKKYF